MIVSIHSHFLKDLYYLRGAAMDVPVKVCVAVFDVGQMERIFVPGAKLDFCETMSLLSS